MAASMHGKILEQIVTEIEALGLVGIDNANIVQQVVPTDQEKYLPGTPGVIVAPLGRERFGAGTNAADDIKCSDIIAIVAVGNQDQTASTFDVRLLWREQILDHFIHNRMTISGVNIIEQLIEPFDIVDRGAWLDGNAYASAMLLTTTIRKLRRV